MKLFLVLKWIFGSSQSTQYISTTKERTNCLHLQLYRDSKDRYKQGQTKASLSLQHFLGVETGFTLDKESNTIAILCQDVTVVLAFDTRERLIQWQVKIASNLGEDQQFLVQISSAPQKAKIAAGPARLHVQEYRFCITMGVPPRLVGVWEISKLRRYGVVESRFCFEGGSRCGKGEGLYVFITDQGEEITRTLQAASEGKMSVRRRPASRNMSVMDSPRKSSTRMSSIGGDTMSLCQRSIAGDSGMDCQSLCRSVMNHTEDHDTSSVWPSSETRTNVSDFGDTASVGDCIDAHSQECHNWVEPGIGRCASCISKLGALSRSSTAGNSTGAGFSPAWIMDNPVNCQGKDRPNYPQSVSSQDSAASEYSVPRQQNELRSYRVASPCECDGPPSRPPKSEHVKLNQNCNTSGHRCPSKIQCKKKPPMPLPNQNYGNYDVPKTIFPQENNSRCYTPSTASVAHPEILAVEHYDTPKAIKECLAYSNYDRPQMVATTNGTTSSTAAAGGGPGWCLTGAHQTRVVLEEDSAGCPCRRLVCWPANWISLPYCRRGNGIENTSVHLHKVKLSGEGKMPVVNKCGGLAIYATIDKSKKLKYRKQDDSDKDKETKENDSGNAPVSCNYVNLDPNNKEPSAIEERLQAPANYENLDFAQSLEYYENSKELLEKTQGPGFSVDRHGIKFCTKCGHACSNANERDGGPSDGATADDYLMMEPQPKAHHHHHQGVKFPGYIPMHPFKPDVFKSSWRKSRGLFERAASIPSLPDRGRRMSCDGETTGRRPSGSAMLGGHTQSANSSPYLMRRRPPVQPPCSKKRSSSMDSTRYEDDDETLRCSQETVESELCPPESQNNGVVENEDAPGEPQPNTQLESPSEVASVQVRRSSSVPCKPSNRDSSSSNDSGVSTGSLKHRGGDFAEFELPLTTSMSSRRLLLAQQPARPDDCCLHASLPRRSKSSDPLKELSFMFPRVKVPAKSSSAEAEVPICHGKREPKDYSSPNGDGAIVVPYIDSRSTSSGTSDMSDYIETLSLSSHSSSDTPDSLRLGRVAVTTLRPRSGKEYHKIDRYILEGDVKTKGLGQVITTVPEKSESPSPGYVSSSPGN